MKKTLDIKKLILLNMPYILLGLFATNFGEAWRMAQGADASEKFLSLIAVLPGALESFWPSLHPLDLLVGLCCGGSLRLAVYLKSKNAKKYRHGLEYGSARWGTREDIAPYVDPVFQNNVILTKTESLTMNSRPKDPKTARNKNVLVIGGSGSGKTRFWLKPNLMQMHSSYVVTDPKGTILVECGKMLQRGAPKLGKDGKPMKDAAKDRFLIGTALNEAQIRGIDTAGVRVVKEHFNAIVAENCMKSQPIHLQRDRYNFDTADRFVEFGLQNGITVTGHTLIWHSQLPRWFVYNDDGTLRSAEELKAIMKEHISTVVGRYKGKVKGWDVVNEAIMEDGSYRRSPFYEILGEEFIPLAFQYAHEADPDAELYYNDYNMWAEGKRNTVVKLIGELRKRGLRIDAVGMQSHMGMDHPDLREYEKSIEAFAAAGVKVMVTEFDMSALPTAYAGADIAGGGMESNRKLNPYPDSLPAEVYDAWHARMEKVLEILLRHSDDITRVTFWGVCDGDSWLNGFPVRGRTDYALPFDRKHNAKPIVKRFIEMCGEIPADGGADNAGVEDNRK